MTGLTRVEGEPSRDSPASIVNCSDSARRSPRAVLPQMTERAVAVEDRSQVLTRAFKSCAVEPSEVPPETIGRDQLAAAGTPLISVVLPGGVSAWNRLGRPRARGAASGRLHGAVRALWAALPKPRQRPRR